MRSGHEKRDAVRLAVGTLSALPVPAPRQVDRDVAGRAMALAPAVGVLLGLLAGGVATGVEAAGGAPLLAATLAVAALAGLTRAMHLDGLADTADGLGSGRPAEGALEVLRRSDVGPFGVVTLVLVLLVQVAALAQVLAALDAFAGLAVVTAAVTVSRLALPLACRSGVPAARADGLGAVVAGSASPTGLLVAVASAGIVLAAATVVAGWPALGLAAGLLPPDPLLRRCRARLGGVTGDVLGALVEVTLAAALLAAALLA